ncbi:MAG: adenosylcobinamide-GDP ribazoletransferase [Hydrogenophilales bacterium CG03_land_8_20_14_0_80_62_28]|nr:adenosylcobinamide-GDP ribazoletransferase [Betaproteobacteria bacterium]OIO79324.1 MAG: adenosylcobinamide-GDP ribazoletransferase [Hydrogenophilaceae bacterium CG1_02_62_390]PIV24237.1 MAG: adenosylcobinamide-GDP ribazoletransferase [Hydrogenophilales bacterium CG03_land_8_20_14_0_80_62_28]PIW39045.1 MAG: adenosylcobinamide-GDP ribazoletransferase [Hydrogenophilales bacterium CG15_BIG_FIL_POST_REV_8_21_14_020_62_31]PIW71444.1 MAG: adenosylcobinamide-GDP ribazoletransferase [Hydrogenophilal
MKALLLALQFLTSIPVNLRAEPRPADWGRSALAYPLIGLLIGLLLAALQRLLGHADGLLQAALLTAAWALITGGLHLDGLADSADAWVGGCGDRERTLAIMKDPRSGPAGVAAIVLVLLVKFAALAALVKTGAWPTLLLAPLLGRSALVALLLTTPYVRPGGLGAAISACLPRPSAALILSLVIGAVLLLAGRLAALALAGAALAWLALRWMMMRRLGGMTGDTLGAAVELTELATLIVLGVCQT